MEVRYANQEDIQKIVKLANKHTYEMGFVPSPVFFEALKRNTLLVCVLEEELVGFVCWYHRKREPVTTLSYLCVAEEFQLRGIGRILVRFVCEQAYKKSMKEVRLKAKAGIGANSFYACLGFDHYAVEQGKKSAIIVWRMNLAESHFDRGSTGEWKDNTHAFFSSEPGSAA